LIQHLAMWLESGGFVMYLLLFGLTPLLAISGLLHLILASRNSFLQLCLCLALVLAVGILATGVQRSRVAIVLSAVRPDERLHLAIVGYREANHAFELSLAISMAGLFPYAIGEIRRSRKRVARESRSA
jgi:multisubunit Na+/H+ antiporter MnhE subunit